MTTVCSKCKKEVEDNTQDSTSIKNTGFCCDCVIGKIKDIIYTNRQKDILFSFYEKIAYDGTHVKIAGYTYFTFDIASQAYVPDIKDVIQRLIEEKKLEEMRKEAIKIYSDPGDYYVACVVDRKNYRQLAENIKEGLRPHQEITTEIIEDDNTFFVDIIISMDVEKYESGNLFTKIDQLMDDIKERICEQKFL